MAEQRWTLMYDDVADAYEIGWKRPLGRHVVATVECGYDEPANRQQHAAARLIVAAPELLALAKDLLDAANSCECGEPECKTTKARALIAKAEGRS